MPNTQNRTHPDAIRSLHNAVHAVPTADQQIFYHGLKPAAVFYPRAGLRGYYGVEVEVSKSRSAVVYNRNDAMHAVYDLMRSRVHVESDGSIPSGFEIVSQPMTLKAHKSAPWERTFAALTSKGLAAHDGQEECGLHIHASRTLFGDTLTEQRETIGKCSQLIVRLWSDFATFSRRANFSWCARPNITYTGHETAQELANMAESAGRSTRYQAINLMNRATVEFRIFRGTLKHSTFIASLEFVDAFVKFARTHSVKFCQRCTFDEMLACPGFDELDAYLRERNLRPTYTT